jgi:hypothetical protein
MEVLEDSMVFQQEEVLFRNGYDIGIGVAMATGSPMALGATGAVTPPGGRNRRVRLLHLSAYRDDRRVGD